MKFELDPLPYGKDALEPHISKTTLDLHYDKHHQGYMSKLEKAIGDTSDADNTLEEIIRSSDGSTFNFAAQIWNHTFYWNSMSPHGGGDPDGKLADMIKQHFGSTKDFKQEFAEAANGEFGSGWAWLVMDSDKALKVISSSDAENPLHSKQTPLLTIDVWEHAYYMDYQNERAKYTESFMDHLINWKFAEKNIQQAG